MKYIAIVFMNIQRNPVWSCKYALLSILPLFYDLPQPASGSKISSRSRSHHSKIKSSYALNTPLPRGGGGGKIQKGIPLATAALFVFGREEVQIQKNPTR